MFGEKFQRKYALTDLGVKNAKQGTLWTVIVNLITMAGICIIYLMMMNFNDVLIKHAYLKGTGMILLLTIVYFILSLFTHMQQYKATYGTVYKEVKGVRIRLAEHLRKLPLGYFGKRDLADLTETIMGDVSRMEHVWSHVIGYLYGAYISTAIIAVIMLLYDWRLTIACLWGVPVAFALLFGGRRLQEKNAKITKKYTLDMADCMQETIETISQIHATGRQEDCLNELYDKIDLHEKKVVKSELISGLIINAASIIMRLGVATTILAGATLIVSGRIDFLVFAVFLLVITRIYAPFDQSLQLIAEMFISQVSANRLMEIEDSQVADGKNSFQPNGHDIVFRHVEFGYDDHPVLKDVSFTAKEGEVTALVGPSGSGKSTLAKLAARLWEVQKGTIEVGGEDISKVDPEVLLRDYSMVFQDVVLFDDTVMENIRLGKRGATDEEVLRAAAAANCDEFVRCMPQGYQTRIGENGARLSGGERQRISIARALLKDAPIVLLDEATASLDVENESKVQGALSELLNQKTVLVIAHRLRTVEAADKIIVLADGKVREEGRPDELMKQKESLYNKMLQLQNTSGIVGV
ncbi:ABC transporter ATP-binding protein [Eubacterium oxidoreducens]|uniref:ATP-binding cassette, subfamily B n=1 Tax=Eubacterium oxidoreducens TaxID=1732 RepID=A0A1G6BIK3_EUBOX|nr:ABC transporter ATP-binding protein [Eubacterium oxidoreducens]SDB20482.1 ATP-binding cassette, subfamily B [Eubacterium oxidoreducens]